VVPDFAANADPVMRACAMITHSILQRRWASILRKSRPGERLNISCRCLKRPRWSSRRSRELWKAWPKLEEVE